MVKTSSLRGFLLLYALAGLRRWRRGSLRYQRRERAHRGLAGAHPHGRADPALALEIARCQRLVKGYSDTHERGTTQLRQADGRRAASWPAATQAAATLQRLRDAALADEHGNALDAALAAAGVRRSMPHGPIQRTGHRPEGEASPRWCSPTACTATCT